MSARQALGVPGRAGDLALWLWIVVLALFVLGPVLAPGFVLSYDMVWVPHLEMLRADVWGLGSGVPRAVPSDAVVAVLGLVLPQQFVQKALLLTALIVAGRGGAALARDLGTPARWAAATLMVWNPFVAERLGLGHWPLLLAYGATPWLVLAVRDRRIARATLLLAVTALTPVSGVMGVVIALVVGRSRDAWRWALLGLAVNAPWIVAAMSSPAGLGSDPAGVEVFTVRGAGSTPAWLELTALGGVWNGDVVPPSRETVVATVLTVLFLAVVVAGLVQGWRRDRREVGPLVVMWVVGCAVALAGVLVPGLLEQLVDHVPGAGLVRDGSRWVVLMVPATVVGFARFVAMVAANPRHATAGWLVALAMPIALVPDLGWGLAGRLDAVHYPPEWAEVSTVLSAQDGPGDLLSLPFSAFRAPSWNQDRPVLDPAGRYFDRVTVTNDTLQVGDVEVAGEDPRAARIGRALLADDWTEVADAGVGFVVLDTSAPGATEAMAQAEDLPIVATAGTLRLYEVPGAADIQPRTARIVAVVTAWLSLAATIAIATLAILRRRRHDPV